MSLKRYNNLSRCKDCLKPYHFNRTNSKSNKKLYNFRGQFVRGFISVLNVGKIEKCNKLINHFKALYSSYTANFKNYKCTKTKLHV